MRSYLVSLRIDDLFQHQELIPKVAGWIYDEFWSDKDEYSAADLEGLLRNATSTDAIPASLIAFVDDKPVGTVNLIENDCRLESLPLPALRQDLTEHR